jgi:hypothetical protein
MPTRFGLTAYRVGKIAGALRADSFAANGDFAHPTRCS